MRNKDIYKKTIWFGWPCTNMMTILGKTLRNYCECTRLKKLFNVIKIREYHSYKVNVISFWCSNEHYSLIGLFYLLHLLFQIQAMAKILGNEEPVFEIQWIQHYILFFVLPLRNLVSEFERMNK